MPVLLTKRKIKRRPEQELQIACAKWLAALEAVQKKKQFTFFHVPNGGYRTPKEGRVFKDMGVKAGVPDIVLLFPARDFKLKLASSELSEAPAVKEWLRDTEARMRQAGCAPGPKTVYVELKVGKVSESPNQKEWAGLLSDYGFEAHLLRVEDVSFQSLNFAINFFQKLLRDNGVAC